jgi:hypothetical protein
VNKSNIRGSAKDFFEFIFNLFIEKSKVVFLAKFIKLIANKIPFKIVDK